MTSRPRRSAAAKATETISVQSKLTDVDDRIDRSGMSSRRSGRASRLDDDFDSGSAKSRQPARGSSRRSGHSDDVRHSARNRGGKKNYVVDSSPDDDDDDEEVDEMDVDADGDEDMDAEGEDDAEGEMDLDSPAPSRNAKPARSAAPRTAAKASKVKTVISDDDDDDELSAANSDIDRTMGLGDDTMADDGSADGSIEVLGDENDRPRDDDEDDEDEEDEEDEEDDEDEDGGAEGETQMEDAEGDDQISSDEDDESHAMTPDLAKMTKRQRARFDEQPQEYMKLSDEVQVKKHFTAEELSMRRQEMARRRRNLSEKRNEEVKMETINKLLKKQAPKVSKKAVGQEGDGEEARPNATWIRWVNNKNGSKVAASEEIMQGPAGTVFGESKPMPPSKMVEEVA